MEKRTDPVSIVIPTWNGRRLLEEFLPSVLHAAERYTNESGAPIEVVVVDDGSTDDTLEFLAERVTPTARVPLEIVTLRANVGFARACNAGAQAAKHQRLLLLNNDLRIAEDAIARLVTAMNEPVETGPIFAVHCRTKDIVTDHDVGTGKVGSFSRGFFRVHRSCVPRDGVQTLPSMFANAGAAMFDRQRFLDLSGFDSLFAPFYFEDVELSYRAWKRGWTIRYAHSALVWHRFSSTIGQFGRSAIAVASHRNRLLLHWIHLHDRRWWRAHVTWTALLAVWSLITLRPAFLRGLRSALRELPEVRRRRRTAKREAMRRDRNIVDLLQTLERDSKVVTYGTRGELASKGVTPPD